MTLSSKSRGSKKNCRRKDSLHFHDPATVFEKNKEYRRASTLAVFERNFHRRFWRSVDSIVRQEGARALCVND